MRLFIVFNIIFLLCFNTFVFGTESNDVQIKAKEVNDQDVSVDTVKISKQEKVVDEDLKKAREKILIDFKNKLIENQKKEIISKKTKQEIIADEFATIKIDNKDDNYIPDDIDEDIIIDANMPITAQDDQLKKEDEYKKRYAEELKNSLSKKKIEQLEKFKNLVSSNKLNNKRIDNIALETNIVEEKVDLNNKVNKNIKIKDPEIFNITDTGINRDILNTDSFMEMINNQVILKKTNTNDLNAILYPIPKEKPINRFKTTEIPQELITFHRSDENKHIPVILTMEDFQEIAKNAITRRDINVLRAIVDATKDPDYLLKNEQTLLGYSSGLGAYDISKYLIYSGANPNIQDLNGNTALHNSVLSDNYQMIKLLTESNSNLNITNIDGYTPLMLAIVNGKDETAYYLLNFTQDLLVKNYKGVNVLDLAIQFNRDIIKELILQKIQEKIK